MSRYEWQYGEIVIPTADWVELKRRVREAYNRYVDKTYRLAQRVYDRAKRGTGSARDRVFDALDAQRGVDSAQWYEIRRELTRGAPNYVCKPRKGTWKHATTRTTHYMCGEFEASITFDNDRHTVVWNVPENNHAAHDAHDSPVAKAFFRALSRIRWTPQSGGTVWGNDEYNEENIPSQDYVVARYNRERTQQY